MKEIYDFSKGIKGKFYVPESAIELPVYLDKKNQEFYLKLAREKKVALSKLINEFLTKDREIIDTAISK